MDKENAVHLHNEVFYSVVINNDILKFTGKWMELEKKIILSEVTQTHKETLHILTHQ